MSLFLIGIIEMIIISMWTRFVSESKIMASGATSVVNIFIWYYVLQAFVDNIESINLVVIYASGCAVGTMITTGFFRYQQKRNDAQIASAQ